MQWCNAKCFDLHRTKLCILHAADRLFNHLDVATRTKTNFHQYRVEIGDLKRLPDPEALCVYILSPLPFVSQVTSPN